MVTTARRDLRSYAFTLIDGYRAADTGRVAEAHPRRPPHFNRPMPFAYVDILVETATHTAGTRERVFSPSFVFVFDPDLGTDDIDTVVDTFADYLTANPHIVPNTIWDVWSVSEESEEAEAAQGLRVFPTVRFTVGNVSIREGRD